MQARIQQVDTASQGDDRWSYMTYFLPCLLAAACYWNALGGQFLHDDLFAIRNNPDVTGSSPVLTVFGHDFWGMRMGEAKSHGSYRPLCTLSFRLDYAISGGNPVWFHVVNTALHVSVTLTLTWVCRRVLHTSSQCALLACCLFAVHPIHTEAVSGIVGRADVMSGLFCLLSLFAYSRCATSCCTASDRDNKADRRYATGCSRQLSLQARYLLATLALTAAAMLCKETGLTVLGLSLTCELALHGGRAVGELRQGQLTWCGRLCLVRGFTLILGGVSLLLFRLWIMNFQQPQVFSEDTNPASFSPSPLTRCLTFLYLPAVNLWLLLCPATLSYDWTGASVPMVNDVRDPRNLASLALYAGITLLVWSCRQQLYLQNKHGCEGTSDLTPLMAVGLMVLPFLPASNLFFRVGFVLAERVLYIPSMGYCLLVARGFLSLGSRWPRLRTPLTVMYLLLLLAMAIRTWDRNRVWESRHSLFWSGVRILPHNDKMHYNLANLLRDEGNVLDAEKHYREAIMLNPNSASYHLNLAALLRNQTLAQQHYREALRLRPHHVGAMVSFGSLLLNHGNHSGLALIRRALQVDPGNFEAVLTMAHALLVNNSLPEAGKYTNLAVHLQPGSARAHLCHGIYLHNTGDTDQALKEYQTALGLDPHDTTALLNSAKIYFKHGRLEEAEAHLQKAANLNTNCSDCLVLLGSVYMKQGNNHQAAHTLALASIMAPNNTYINLKYVQALKDNQHNVKARSVLQELMLRVPGNAAVLKFAFTYAMEEKRYTEALQHILEVISLVEANRGSSLSSLYRDLGNVYRHTNNLTRALQAVKKAIQFNSSYVEAIMDAGSIHFLQKNFKQAESYYLQALRIDKHNNLVKQNLDKLKHFYHKSDQYRNR